MFAPPEGRFPIVPALDTHACTARESELFARVIETGPLDATVPGCPEWSVRELTWHLGRVQRFWATVVQVGADRVPVFGEPTSGPTDAVELAAWMRASTAELLDAVRSIPPNTPAWAWWRDDHTVGAIARHQVQEAAVHRWDAQSAFGAPDPIPVDPIPVDIADDGVDEFLWIARQLRSPARLAFVTTDSGRTTTLSDEPALATVSATASDIVLLLHMRLPTDAVHIDGDPAALDAFLQPIA
jgi:uncharacterized protein (TIGR03083 family)